MRIIHRISAAVSEADRNTLARWGIVVGLGFQSFDIDESHPDWKDVKRWVQQRGAVDIADTSFTKKEIAAADVLQLRPDWHWDYPQPDDGNFGYLGATFDLADYCSECGIGLLQNAPFQFRSEPKWGRREILQVNWVFDQYFVTPSLHARVFAPLGVASRPVLHARKGTELSTVVQLVVDEVIECAPSDTLATTCARCGRVKFEPPARGYFPEPLEPLTQPIAWTKAYFGSGGSANRAVLVSRRLASALIEHKVRGASLRPAASSH